MKEILTAPFLAEMTHTASNMYRLGWDERNGGNISLLLEERDVSPYLELSRVLRKIPLGFQAASLAGRLFLVTGTGKYFKNVARDPEENLGLFRISQDGVCAELLWGYRGGGQFTSELPAHLMSHMARLSVDPANRVVMHSHPTHTLAMNYVHVGTWDKIPDAWRGREASLSMILDWINSSQISQAQQIDERRRAGDQMAALADPMYDLFMGAVDEARQYAYAHRAILELTQLANTPDKERGSILSTVMEGLSIFRNAAVRNRTSHSDFHFADLRGMTDPRDGKVKPVTVYLSINMVDAQALNPITGIFIELMTNFLLSNPPESKNGNVRMGPCPVLFVLDEMPKMQKLQAVIQGPDLGRGQKISYLIIGQDIHQIQEKYGADAAATIISTTAAKIGAKK